MVASRKRQGRAGRGAAAVRGDQPRDQKVTARFTEEEFEQITKLSGQRKEKLSSLVRDLVLSTVGEVRDTLKKPR